MSRVARRYLILFIELLSMCACAYAPRATSATSDKIKQCVASKRAFHLSFP